MMSGVSAILTAAGESVRMGFAKPLLSWHGVTLVEYQVRCLLKGGASEVVAVLGHDSDAVVPHVERSGARYVVNPDYRLGKTTSIKAGLRHVDPRAGSILLLAVDQPRSVEIISKVLRAHVDDKALITSPRFHGHGGHPVVFSAVLRAELEGISEGKRGIREVFEAHRHEVIKVEFDDPLVRLDLNTRDEYEEARIRYGA